jgi:hypothetical protein
MNNEARARTRHLLRRFQMTSAAIVLAFAVLLAAVFWNIDVFELPGVNILGIEQSEAGEIALAFLLIVPAFFADQHIMARQIRHEAQLQLEQLRVLRVTTRTVHDIVSNNLNQLQLLRLEAEGHVSTKTVRLFDGTLEDIATQLTALGNMAVFAERPMAMGSAFDVSSGA